MIDPILERKYADCRELLDLWRKYHDYFKIAVAGKEITPEKEHDFITVKSRIAMVHDSFMDSLEHDQNIGQNVLAIVTRSITLKHIHRMSTAEIKKIELEWHESYLLLNETIGLLEDKRDAFAEIKPSDYYRRMYIKKAKDATLDFISSWTFKALVASVVIIVGVFFAREYKLMEWLYTNPTTRGILVKWENIVRAGFSNYPYRDLELFQRSSPLPPSTVEIVTEIPDIQAYKPTTGIERAKQKIGTNPEYDFTSDLRKYESARTELYRPKGGAQGGDCVVWLYRMPSSKIAESIAEKYQKWFNAVGSNRGVDWHLFRDANIVGLVLGDDRNREIRRWVLTEYGAPMQGL